MTINTLKLAVCAAALTVGFGLTATTQANAQAAVMKECSTDYSAAKAAGTLGDKTWPGFLADCRLRKANATPVAAPAPAAPAPAPAPVVVAPAPKPPVAAAPAPVAPPVAKVTPAPAPTPSAKATGAGQFATPLEAKGRCPADTVVWVNTKSKIYHYEGSADYGKTKRGAFMCQADANAAGDRAAKDEKPKL